jgi:CheY-like chemotaxis protein
MISPSTLAAGYLGMGAALGVLLAQAPPPDGGLLGLPPGLVGALSGSAWGGAALLVYAAGTSIIGPWLRERGTQAKLDAATAVSTRNEDRIKLLEEKNVDATAKLADATTKLADATFKVARLAQSLLVLEGRLKAEAEAIGSIEISDAPPPADGPRVLLVEDSEESRVPMTILLEGLRFRVEHAAGRAEALAGLGTRPDAVVLDLMLPDGDGADVLRAVREGRLTSERGRPIRVVVTTGRVPETLGVVQALRPDALLHKPISFKDLVAALRGGDGP